MEVHHFEINRHDALITKPVEQPVRILHLSDTHFSGPNHAMARFFDRLGSEEYDLVVYTGDIIDSPEGIPRAVDNLKKLKARYGVFCVLGNHDYYDYHWSDLFMHHLPWQSRQRDSNESEKLIRELRAAGFHVLRNEAVPVTIGKTRCLIHGIDDPTTKHHDIDAVRRHFDPECINILLTHTIDVFFGIGKGEVDLSFSGHSHGGQVRLPLIGPVLTHTRFGRDYCSGLVEMKGAQCMVSRGIGCGRSNYFRLLCPPEAVVLTLKNGDSPQ